MELKKFKSDALKQLHGNWIASIITVLLTGLIIIVLYKIGKAITDINLISVIKHLLKSIQNIPKLSPKLNGAKYAKVLLNILIKTFKNHPENIIALIFGSILIYLSAIANISMTLAFVYIRDYKTWHGNNPFRACMSAFTENRAIPNITSVLLKQLAIIVWSIICLILGWLFGIIASIVISPLAIILGPFIVIPIFIIIIAAAIIECSGPIMAIYMYALIPYIINDYTLSGREISAQEALQSSRETMQYNKMKLFKFDISFLGWFILCILTYGIGFLWFIPYYLTAKANFYRNLVKDPYLA